LIFLAGLIDDIRGLSPRLKLIIQITAALVVVAYGLAPSAVAFVPESGVWNAGPTIGIGMLVFWIVGITNAFNLIDGLDGLASSFAIIAASVSLGSVFIIQANLPPAIPTVLVGATIGFLRYNWSPARVFLGDTGSMTLGFILSILTVISATDASGVTYPIIPLFALAFPITDTLVAMARRWVRGVSFSVADRRHIHHQLRALGLSVPQTVKILVVAFSGIAALGLITVFAPRRFTLAMIVGGVSLPAAAILYGLRWLQYEEFVEFGSSVQSALRHARHIVRTKIIANEAAMQIGRAGSVEEIREILDTLATRVGLLDIELIEPGQRERATPPSQQIAPLDALPMRLDYTFAASQSLTTLVIIRLWSGAPSHSAPHVMERTVMRIGKAIETWYARRWVDSLHSNQDAASQRSRNQSARDCRALF
jgi:UDP-GlcNAc:undecaprenyl-phosphate GlcNAc-1-phosphate transferase